ncbi:AMP-binding protein [Roseibium sp. CAU 1637]|uniref:AMP-binding protein n=1 Tax=Roseibium limicola TaxID=2816037 RepID=A0A939ET56_9HYPH|nr:AMP-binding protein [Roseibium limicola]MBO0346654.1 AMP-binding protein [Roseibium limicola]
MLQPAASHEVLTSTFQWQIPTTYNIATSVSDQWADRTPDALAIRHVHLDGNVSDWSHLRLNRAANRLANGLIAKGVEPGDRVALLLPQSPQTAIAHLAVYKIGAIAVPLAALFGLEALRYRLTDSGAKALVCDVAGFGKLQDIGFENTDLMQVIVAGDVREGSGVSSLDRLCDQASDQFETRMSRPDDPALMIYTSGTTGNPKGVLHGHRVLLGHLPGIQMSQDFMPQSGDLLWTPSDWAWAGGLLNALFPALHCGVPVLSSDAQKFDPEWAFRFLAQHGVRNAFIPPTALKMMRSVPDPVRHFGLSWRSVGSAGEMLGRETYDWFSEEFGFSVNEFYGQTECNAVLGSCRAAGISRAGAIGRAVPGHEVAIIDADGGRLGPGEQGQIAVKRPDPVMFLEYWGRPDATAEKFVGGWMTTGDQGVMDEDGYVFFVGRDDDVITSAGYRIGPGEIEDCLLTHPAVALAAVIGKPDKLRTEIVKAYLVASPGLVANDTLREDIKAFVRTRLSAHEYPREIEFVDSLPLTTSGKVIRRELRARAEQDLD